MAPPGAVPPPIRRFVVTLALALAGCGGGGTPNASGGPTAPATVQLTFAGDLSGPLSNPRVADCGAGGFTASGEVGGTGITVHVEVPASGGREAVSAGGHPLISITSPGSTGPTGSATGGTIAPGAGGRSGSLDAELALTRGGRSRLTGTWTC